MKEESIPSIKNKGFFRALCLLLILLIMGTGGYTYARYMGQEKGTGSAEIANWSFKIAKNEGEETKTVKLSDQKIAPGMSGKFTIKLDATGGDTALDYVLKFENEKNKPENLVFNYNGLKFKTLSEIDKFTGTMTANGVRVAIYDISWSWPYQTGYTEEEKQLADKRDTEDAANLSDYTFDIVAVATQKDTNK